MSASGFERGLLFKTRNPNVAREQVAQQFNDHELVCTGDPNAFDCQHNAMHGAALSLNHLRYGAEVTINPGETENFYLVQLPIRGWASVRNGGKEVSCSSNVGSVLNPTRISTMRWSAGCEKNLIRIDRRKLCHVAEDLTGYGLDRPVVFDPAIVLGAGEHRRWHRSVLALFLAAEHGDVFSGRSSARDTMIEDNMLAEFLAIQESNVIHLVRDRMRAIQPRHITILAVLPGEPDVEN